MTPKVFLDSQGQPFAHTVLDARAGVLHQRGNYMMASHLDRTPMLDSEIFENIKTLCHKAENSMDQKRFEESKLALTEALEQLPQPSSQWNAAGWILLALGENAACARDYKAVIEALGKAVYTPGTIGNPWLHLRFGQAHFELRNKDGAASELIRAYMGGGRDIFLDLDPKYFRFLQTSVQAPQGGW